MRESAMGRSKRKRSSRVSSGGGSMRASHGLGPLQEVCVGRYAHAGRAPLQRGLNTSSVVLHVIRVGQFKSTGNSTGTCYLSVR